MRWRGQWWNTEQGMVHHLEEQSRVDLQQPLAAATAEEMMAIDDWDGNEYDVVIRSSQRGCRRRLQQQQQQQHVQREQLCLGMDVTLALHWESLINNSCRHSSSSREFEFDMGAAPEAAAEGGDEDGISPADELFYKGQLLPLHLRPRLQMVEKLSFENQQEKEADNDDDDEEEIAPSSSAAAVIQGMMMVREPPSSNRSPAGGFSRLFQPGYNTKFGLNSTIEVAPVVEAAAAAAADYRSSSFRSQNSGSGSSMWESAADNSSRDSSGSSQDACFGTSNELDTTSTTTSGDSCKSPALKSSFFKEQPPFLHDREVFSTHSKQPEKSTVPSWIRPPFKWKVLFGVKQDGKKPSHPEKPPHAQQSRTTQQQRNRFSESYSSSACPPSPRHFNAPLPLSPRKQRNREQQAWSRESGQAGFVPFARAPEDKPGNSADEEERREACNVEEAPEFRHSQSTADSSETAEVELCSAAGDGREERLSKSRDRWTKYIKMLKPLSVKLTDNAPPRTSSSSLEAPGAISSSRKSGRLSFVKPAAVKKSAVAPRRKSLSGSLIFPSMSQTSTTRMAAIGWAAPRRSDGSDSSNNCGLLRQISHSTISDLQSSLQGAIAHCKQSHASASAHATTTRSSFILRNNLLAP
ncbi:unnamed protein product [Sphagnum jensenii]|uniref:Uncharacterized protein n=1 Tax=Sphagnum jensenii TaxID=128206 RepID=A0ABP1BXB1_9BRYO